MSYYGVGDGLCFSCGGFAGHVKPMFVHGAARESIDDIDERQIAAWMKHVASVSGVGGKKR